MCDIGGASAAGTGVELRLTESHPSKLAPTTIESHGQPTVSGPQGIACESATSCEAAEVQDLAVFGQFQGWLEHLDRSLSGTPHKITTPTTATQMYAVATVNRSYYFGVGYSAGVNWLTDLVSAAGKVGPDRTATPGGYLQGVSCPVRPSVWPSGSRPTRTRISQAAATALIAGSGSSTSRPRPRHRP